MCLPTPARCIESAETCWGRRGRRLKARRRESLLLHCRRVCGAREVVDRPFSRPKPRCCYPAPSWARPIRRLPHVPLRRKPPMMSAGLRRSMPTRPKQPRLRPATDPTIRAAHIQNVRIPRDSTEEIVQLPVPRIVAQPRAGPGRRNLDVGGRLHWYTSRRARQRGFGSMLGSSRVLFVAEWGRLPGRIPEHVPLADPLTVIHARVVAKSAGVFATNFA